MTIKNNAENTCPEQFSVLPHSRHVLRMVSGKWSLEILFQLVRGTCRFGELRRSIPDITQHVLTARLRELEANGLVTRTVYAEVPPRVEYALTSAAMALKPVFEALLEWVLKHGDQLCNVDN